jgi:hypothetical protein
MYFSNITLVLRSVTDCSSSQIFLDDFLLRFQNRTFEFNYYIGREIGTWHCVSLYKKKSVMLFSNQN